MLFGPERSGLDNDTISLADAILTAPVSPDFASLSLPQAVLLFGYEWLKAESAALRRSDAPPRSMDPPSRASPFPTRGRPRERSCSACSTISRPSSIGSGFLYPPEKRPSMVRAIRNMFHRMGATEQDVRTWRGIVASLSRKHAPRRKKGVIVPPRFSYCDGRKR